MMLNPITEGLLVFALAFWITDKILNLWDLMWRKK